MHVDVIIALTGQTVASRYKGVPKITRGALITPGSFVARTAHTHQLVIQMVTAVHKLPSTAWTVGAHAGAAVAT